MSKKEIAKIIRISLLLIGIFFVLNSKLGITGGVIGINLTSSASLLIGAAALILAVISSTSLLNLEKRLHKGHLLLNKSEKYYHERALELTENENDAWISQWEISGLKKELEKNGFKIRGPDTDLGGYKKGPGLRHMSLYGYNAFNRRIKNKHLIISTDPYDSRLLRSKTYDPKHKR